MLWLSVSAVAASIRTIQLAAEKIVTIDLAISASFAVLATASVIAAVRQSPWSRVSLALIGVVATVAFARVMVEDGLPFVALLSAFAIAFITWRMIRVLPR